MSKNEVHKEFQKQMQTAWGRYTPQEQDIKIPEPDLSFLNKEKTQEQGLNLDFLDVKPKRKSIFSNLGKIAAVIIALFITSSAIAVFINSDSSYGVKGIFQNIKHFVSPEEEPAMDEDGQETLEITKWSELNAGKQLVEHLYVPGYIPQGYTFKKATFIKTVATATIEYEYVRGKQILVIYVEEMKTSGDVYVAGKPYKSPISGKNLYVLEDKEINQYNMSYLDGHNMFAVSGYLSRGENVKIIENIKEL